MSDRARAVSSAAPRGVGRHGRRVCSPTLVPSCSRRSGRQVPVHSLPKIFNLGGYGSVSSSPALARKPSMSPDRYCTRFEPCLDQHNQLIDALLGEVRRLAVRGWRARQRGAGSGAGRQPAVLAPWPESSR